MEIVTVNDFYNQTGTFENISTTTVDYILARAKQKLADLKSKGSKVESEQLNKIIAKVLFRSDKLSAFITLEIIRMLDKEFASERSTK